VISPQNFFCEVLISIIANSNSCILRYRQKIHRNDRFIKGLSRKMMLHV
jgi:hypothetical protein